MNEIQWPILASEQLQGGNLTFRELRRYHQAVYPGVWIPRGAELDAIGRTRAAWLWSRRQGVLCSLSAATVQGAKWIDSDAPAELIHDNRRPPPGISVRSDLLAPGEVGKSMAWRSPRQHVRLSTSVGCCQKPKGCNALMR